jgi:hypothetical protein
LSCLPILRTYGPYLSTVEVATLRKLFAARKTSAECSALMVRNCHAVQLDQVYSSRAVIPTNSPSQKLGTSNVCRISHVSKRNTKGKGKEGAFKASTLEASVKEIVLDQEKKHSNGLRMLDSAQL